MTVTAAAIATEDMVFQSLSKHFYFGKLNSHINRSFRRCIEYLLAWQFTTEVLFKIRNDGVRTNYPKLTEKAN